MNILNGHHCITNNTCNIENIKLEKSFYNGMTYYHLKYLNNIKNLHILTQQKLYYNKIINNFNINLNEDDDFYNCIKILLDNIQQQILIDYPTIIFRLPIKQYNDINYLECFTKYKKIQDGNINITPITIHKCLKKGGGFICINNNTKEDTKQQIINEIPLEKLFIDSKKNYDFYYIANYVLSIFILIVNKETCLIKFTIEEMEIKYNFYKIDIIKNKLYIKDIKNIVELEI